MPYVGAGSQSVDRMTAPQPHGQSDREGDSNDSPNSVYANCNSCRSTFWLNGVTQKKRRNINIKCESNRTRNSWKIS